jgi:hypothetical protein
MAWLAHAETGDRRLIQEALPGAQQELPPLSTKHLRAMSDKRGISEFAHGVEPMRDRFCIEDTARALVAVLKLHALAPDEETTALTRLYLDVIARLQQADGRFHFGFQKDEGPMSRMAEGDAFTRTLWGLGHASAHGLGPTMRQQAQALFLKALPHLKPSDPMATSYAVQGLHLFLKAQPTHDSAKQALRACADHLLKILPGDAAEPWQWPKRVVTYDSARLPLALLLAYETTKDESYCTSGLRVLDFLCLTNFPGDGTMLHIIGNRGWHRQGQPPAEWDQQPIDASGIVEASAQAWHLTADEKWRTRARTAFAWFTGHNMTHHPIYDATTASCRDALARNGTNNNAGAESTVSYLIARCEIATLGALKPQLPNGLQVPTK